MSITNTILRLDNGIQLRGGTAAALASSDIVPSEREIIIETDTSKIKIGDGVTSWNSLEYANGNTQDIGNLANLATDDKDTLVKAVNEVVGNIGALSGLSTSTKTDVISAINSIITERGALSGLTTSTKTSLVAAINTLVSRIATLEGYKHTLYDYIDSISTSSNGAGLHNSIYRGQSLGSSLTSTQCSNISSWTFKGLYIGDYWVVTVPAGTYNGTSYSARNIKFRIADFNYYLNTYDSNKYLQVPHVVIVPDDILYNAKMNDNNTTTGGYGGSKMRSTYLNSAKSIINNAFGSSHVLKHKISLVSGMSNGKSNGHSYYDCTVELMNEHMVYGAPIISSMSDGTNISTKYLYEKSQLNLFKHRHDLIINENNYWLQDIVSAVYFACVGALGNAGCYEAANSIGVRPAFAIC